MKDFSKQKQELVMDDVVAKTEGELMRSLFLHGLRVSDPRLNQVTGELFVRQGTKTVPQLVREALDKKNSTAHRLRVMNVLRRIWETSGPAPEFINLSVLHLDRNEQVREATGRFFGTDRLKSCQRPPASREHWNETTGDHVFNE